MSLSFSYFSLLAIAAIIQNTHPRFFVVRATFCFFITRHKPFSIITCASLIVDTILTKNRFSFKPRTKNTFDNLTLGEMVDCPQCVTLKLCPLLKTTILETSKGSPLINWAFEDTMCWDALVSRIHVFDPASDCFPPN